MGPWRTLSRERERKNFPGCGNSAQMWSWESKLRRDVGSGFHPLRGAALQCVLEPGQLCKRLETLRTWVFVIRDVFG